MNAGYHILEHPADIGIEAWGPSFSDALSQACEGLMGVMVDPGRVEPSVERVIAVSASDRESLVVRVLSDVIYLFDAERFISARLQITELTETAMKGTILGEPLREDKHKLRQDVKAVTYHQLSVSQSSDGVHINVFLDV